MIEARPVSFHYEICLRSFSHSCSVCQSTDNGFPRFFWASEYTNWSALPQTLLSPQSLAIPAKPPLPSQKDKAVTRTAPSFKALRRSNSDERCCSEPLGCNELAGNCHFTLGVLILEIWLWFQSCQNDSRCFLNDLTALGKKGCVAVIELDLVCIMWCTT